MSNSSIYENGLAELALVRAVFPFVAVMSFAVIGWHFGGFESQSTNVERILATITTRLAWLTLFAIPALGFLLSVANPPRLKLPLVWIAVKIGGAVIALALVFWVVSTMLPS